MAYRIGAGCVRRRFETNVAPDDCMDIGIDYAFEHG